MHTDHHEIAERIYTENHRSVAKILAGRHHRRPDDPAVQDAIAGAIVRLIEHLQRGGSAPVNEIAWLTLVAGREYHRPDRSPVYRLRFPLTEIDDNTLADGHPGPEDAFIDRATDDGIQRALDQALGRLSPLQRHVVTAQASGLTYAEIAERSGLSYTVVSKAIDRARRNLRIDGRLEQQLKAWRD